MASNRMLSDDEVTRGFHSLLDEAIKHVKMNQALSAGWAGTEPEVNKYGPALCLYYSACRSDTAAPGVRLLGDGQMLKLLQDSTCPRKFIPFFRRWALVVPHIRSLTTDHNIDLERLLCDKLPISLPPVPSSHTPWSISAEESALNHIRSISDELHSLASDITRLPCFQYRYNPPLPLTLDMNAFATPRTSVYLNSRPSSYVGSSSSGFKVPYAEDDTNSSGSHYSPTLQSTYGSTFHTASPISVSQSSPALPSPPRPLLQEDDRFVGGFAVQRTLTDPFGTGNDGQGRFTAGQPSGLPAYSFPDTPPRNNTMHEMTHIVLRDEYSTSSTAHSSYSTSSTSSTEKITAMISSQMSAAEIIAHLGRHGCRNLTHHLDTASFSNGPVNRGGVGEIHRGRLNDGRRVAIKTVFLRTDEDERDQKYLKHAAQELHTWSKCRHRNVAPLLGVAEFRGQIAMLSPWMENGTLHDYVNREPGADRCDLSAQVAQGLAYLHSIGIIHGDLKGANVLVSFDGIAALTDFDNAVLGETTLQFTKTEAKERMSIRWTAPEILTSEGECSPEADVYALGMTILETLTGNVPYFGKNENAVMFSVGVNKEFPKRPEEHISSSSAQGDILWSMLINCWWHDPQERPRAELVYEVMKAITPGGLVSRSEI